MSPRAAGPHLPAPSPRPGRVRRAGRGRNATGDPHPPPPPPGPPTRSAAPSKWATRDRGIRGTKTPGNRLRRRHRNPAIRNAAATGRNQGCEDLPSTPVTSSTVPASAISVSRVPACNDGEDLFLARPGGGFQQVVDVRCPVRRARPVRTQLRAGPVAPVPLQSPRPPIPRFTRRGVEVVEFQQIPSVRARTSARVGWRIQHTQGGAIPLENRGTG